ncbi:hypothetical protein WA026_019835 [Henosepilachna vigintioctopunctata]|uniref:Uncharacterized protein n=1 Tax=Henosepilachna vigintioctopunctata TaxID=420089 RepID=A0AAW1VHS9_9CUCU
MPKTGDFLGMMTNELETYGKKAHITDFMSTGPMSYSFEVFSPDTISQIPYDVELSKDPIERGHQIAQQCEKELNFEQKDYIQDFKKIALSKDVSEKHLCYLKCYYHKHGSLDEKGFLVFERIDEILSMFKFNDEDKKKITACLKKIEPTNKCADVIHITECFSQKES